MTITENQRQHIRQARQNADKTCRELGQATGVKPSEISMIEGGRMECDRETYELICAALEVDPIKSPPKNVINFPTSPKHSPHVSGEAVCLNCKHEWISIAPVGTTWLECPNCGLHKGAGKYPVIPQEYWQCTCGMELFYITPKGAMCPQCGKMQAW
ncbi:helix-turn-helix domain-containing protein [Desulfovibrio inopinatus]|uniref:helix-turn-helix domain-containing protein n=1 Tax=Desulfovibrio inopinatus TaxID=102109 RepID=UPI0006851A67|nr:helix-turn-helix transcriptional regulator [Desulfovibrio inopinatus]